MVQMVKRPKHLEDETVTSVGALAPLPRLFLTSALTTVTETNRHLEATRGLHHRERL